jgi:hypothetical protein
VSYVIASVFEGVGEEQYWAVNERLGIDRDAGGELPAGMVHHAAGPTTGGGWLVVERWESRAAQQAFMQSRLGGALGAAGVPAPVSIFDTDAVNEISPG